MFESTMGPQEGTADDELDHWLNTFEHQDTDFHFEQEFKGIPNPRRDGYRLFVSIIRAHSRVLKLCCIATRVIRSYARSCIRILCDGKPKGLPTLLYNDYVTAGKFICEFPLSFLLAERGSDNKRLGSDLAVGKSHFGAMHYFENCEVDYKTWAKSRMLSAKPKTIFLWSSFLKAKNAADTVSPGYVLDNLIKHQKRVTTPNDLSEDLIEEFMSVIDPVLTKLASKVTKKFPEFDFKVPQTTASYESSVKDGGGLGWILRESLLADQNHARLPDVLHLCPVCEEPYENFGPFPIDGESPFATCPICGMGHHSYKWFLHEVPETSRLYSMDVPGSGNLTRNCTQTRSTTNTTYPHLSNLRVTACHQNGRPVVGVDGEFSHVKHEAIFREVLGTEFESVSSRFREYNRDLDFFENFGFWPDPDGYDGEDTGNEPDSGIRGLLSCTVIPIVEPLKVRLITKGETFPYYLSSKFQKCLASVIKKVPCFRLLGRPVSPTDLYDLKEYRYAGDGGELGGASSDFSAASDGSSLVLNRMMLERLVSGLSREDQDVILASNAPHNINYHCVDDFTQLRWWGEHGEVPSFEDYCYLHYAPHTGDLRKYTRKHKLGKVSHHQLKREVTQMCGTLMGSLTSFPLLSLYVLGVHLVNLQRCGDERPLGSQLKGVLVNGDDRLTISSKAVETQFDQTCRDYGMNLSPGKSYWHRKYFNINSTAFYFDPNGPLFGKGSSSPYYVPYFNIGLFLDKRKVKKSMDIPDDPLAPEDPRLVSILPEILHSCVNEEMKTLVLKEYLRKWSGYGLKRQCKGRNLFIPHSLGGWGIVPPIGWKWEVTMKQRKLASGIYHSQPCGWPCKIGPLPSKSTPSPIGIFCDIWVNSLAPPPNFHKHDPNEALIGKRKMVQGIRLCDLPRPFSKSHNRTYRHAAKRMPAYLGCRTDEANGTLTSLSQLADGPLFSFVENFCDWFNSTGQSIVDVPPQYYSDPTEDSDGNVSALEVSTDDWSDNTEFSRESAADGDVIDLVTVPFLDEKGLGWFENDPLVADAFARIIVGIADPNNFKTVLNALHITHPRRWYQNGMAIERNLGTLTRNLKMVSELQRRPSPPDSRQSSDAEEEDQD